MHPQSQNIKITNIRSLTGENGGLVLLADVDKQSMRQCKETVSKAVEGLKNGKEYCVDFRPVKKCRSLDANAYFHVLISKIAGVTHQSEDDVKDNLVLNYGAIAQDKNGNGFCVYLPKTVDVKQYWRYARWIGESGGCNMYMLYKQTHTLTGAEMARLIEGTISEAKQLGIETATPEEQAILTAYWEEKYNGNERETNTSTARA